MFLTLSDPVATRAVLVDGEASRRELFASVLADRGFIIAGGFVSPAAAIDAAPEADLAIYHAGAGGGDAPSAVSILREGLNLPLMALVDEVRPSAIERLIKAGADQVVPVGVQSDRILVGAIAAAAARERFDMLIEAKARAEAALASTRLVARAKGILMNRHGLTEEDAHRRVQKVSMTRNLSVADAARAIIDAEELLGSSEA